MNYNDVFTKDMARRIYYDLEENKSGQLPYPDFKVIYTLDKREENGKPLEVDIEIISQNGGKDASYLMKYENGFSDFRVIKGNQIVRK